MYAIPRNIAIPRALVGDDEATAKWLVANVQTPPQWVWLFVAPRRGWKVPPKRHF